MSNEFNLNVFNYTNSELLDLLSIEKPYSVYDIAESCNRLKERLFRDYTKTEGEKAAMNGFLKQVKSRLLSNATSPIDPPTMPPPPRQTSFRADKKILNIDTRFRENYYSTKSTNFDIPIIINNVTSMKLVGLELPSNSIFMINKNLKNNFFHIKVDEWHIIRIDNGNYTQNEIIFAINTKIRKNEALKAKVQASINRFSNSIIFTFSKDIKDGKLAFNRNGLGILDTKKRLQHKLGWILGFTSGEYSSGTSPIQFTAAAPYNNQYPKYLYLAVNDFNENPNNTFIGGFNKSLLDKNILARFPYYKNSQLSIDNIIAPERKYPIPKNIEKLNIQLLDEYGRIVSLNNRNFSLALEFN